MKAKRPLLNRIMLSVGVVIAVGVVLWIGVSVRSFSSDSSRQILPSYRGSLPFSERQSAAQYHEETVPVLEEFYSLVGQKSGVELETRIDFYSNPDCREGKFHGIDVEDRGYHAGPGVSLESVLEAGEETLTLAGFEGPTIKEDEGSYTLQWQEKNNGGYVRMYLTPATGMGSSSASGCRPEK